MGISELDGWMDDRHFSSYFVKPNNDLFDLAKEIKIDKLHEVFKVKPISNSHPAVCNSFLASCENIGQHLLECLLSFVINHSES